MTSVNTTPSFNLELIILSLHWVLWRWWRCLTLKIPFCSVRSPSSREPLLLFIDIMGRIVSALIIIIGFKSFTMAQIFLGGVINSLPPFSCQDRSNTFLFSKAKPPPHGGNRTRYFRLRMLTLMASSFWRSCTIKYTSIIYLSILIYLYLSFFYYYYYFLIYVLFAYTNLISIGNMNEFLISYRIRNGIFPPLRSTSLPSKNPRAVWRAACKLSYLGVYSRQPLHYSCPC